MPGPLTGVRVLDVTTVVLGPWATQALGDMGADVIKIEPPEGDTTRRLGPARHPGMAAFYLACNRNKRSLVLDLKQAAGRGALLRLAATADVILHNFRPGPAARLGLEYEAFRAVNPRLVYCATYGFRARGPYGDKPAYDDVIQAAAGLASLQAPLVGEPRYVPTIVADKTSSLAVLSAVLSALFHRERTGEGQAIEVPMFETVVAYVMVEHLYGETFVPPLETAGYERILNRWRRPFRTRDGYLAVVPYTDADWRAFFAVAGRPDLLADPRFTTLESRLANIEVLYEELSKIVATRRDPPPPAATRRAQPRGAPRSGIRRGGDRRHAGLRRDVRRAEPRSAGLATPSIMSHGVGVREVGYFDCAGGGQVVVSGDVAFVAHMHAPNGTTLVDVRDPSAPRRLATLEVPKGTHSHKVRAANGVMLVNREAQPANRPTPGFQGGLGVFD